MTRRRASLLVAIAIWGTSAPATPLGPRLPGRLYLDDRPDAAWISLESARAGGSVSHWRAWGEFSPTMLIEAIERWQRWLGQEESRRDLPANAAPLGLRWRDDEGGCRHSLAVGHANQTFESASGFLDQHRLVLAGTIQRAVPGFLYGRPVTTYELKVDTTLKGLDDPLQRTWRTLFIPHGDFDAKIEGQDVCYWARSRPRLPAVGRRAVVGLRGRPLTLWEGTESSGRPYRFSSSWTTSSFWFESEDGTGWTAMPGEPEPWATTEREIVQVALRK